MPAVRRRDVVVRVRDTSDVSSGKLDALLTDHGLDGARQRPVVGPAMAQLAEATARALDDPEFASLVAHHRKRPVTILSEPLMDAEHVGALLKIPGKTVLMYARDGRLPCRQLGRHVRFVRAEVAAAIERGALG
jgi:excisionase family DNA binding protein